MAEKLDHECGDSYVIGRNSLEKVNLYQRRAQRTY